MKKYFTFLTGSFMILTATAQEPQKEKPAGKPVRIFNAGKTINARTTETTGLGKMDFNITHNFGDLAGSNGGIKRFFGLDNAADVRIGFHIGLGKNTDLVIARAKGAGPVQQLYEVGIKQKLMQQMENDPSRPLSIAVYANHVIAAQKANSTPDQENSFDNLGDRSSNILQLMLAKKIGQVSLQLSPTYLGRGYAVSYDQQHLFALGAAIKLPLVPGKLNLVTDYFLIFRNQESKDAYATNNNIKFYNPLGIGFEYQTAGHMFRMNFTNATEILENRFIPRTITSWGKGQFRWGFTVSRAFTLWRK